MTITHANIQFNDNGTPYAPDFDDLYFSDAKGLAETEYVFLKHNRLFERWQDWPHNRFVIAETGFGTGLNFLVTLLHFEQWRQLHPDNPFVLHFISIEKFPIAKDDLEKALSFYPQLSAYSEQLLDQYPHAVSGCHRLSFMQGQVVLDLWLGDVHQVLPQIENKPQGIVDAWYLDGFAPSKNPEMWSQTLFDHMALLAKQDCSFATFTAAGFVRRGLIGAGFNVQKYPGHGHKREMVAGKIDKIADNPIRRPYFYRQSTRNTNVTAKTTNPTQALEVAIIGGGLAGSNCALALSKRGINSQIYCQDEALAEGASGNTQGGFYPQLNAEQSHASQFHALAFCYASQVYRHLLNSGQHFTHQWCGTIQVAFNEKVEARYRKLVQNQTWPESLIHWIDAQQASQIANLTLPYSGLFVADGGWLHLPELVNAMTNAAGARVNTNKTLLSMTREQDKWQLSWKDGSLSQADIVIMATGSHSPDFAQTSELPFRLVRGQVESVTSDGQLRGLSTVLCHKGYLTPALQGQHTIGSTYVKADTNTEYRLSEQQSNLRTQQKALDQCPWIHQLTPTQTGRAGIRCSTPDHLPMVGAVPDISQQRTQYQDLYKALPAKHYPKPEDQPNLFLLSGLGSRGLTTAPLCAEILASQILNEPLPISNHLLDTLNPNRFLVKGLIRREID